MTDIGRRVPAGEFKARCLKLMDDVQRDHVPIIVTKRGKPVVKIVPLDNAAPPLFGALAGSLSIVGDIITPIETQWEAATSEDEDNVGP